MNEFLEQFGIDWKLFLSQLLNFAIILVVLKFFVFDPVLRVLKKRNEKIKEGLDKAEEAGVRLKEIDNIGKVKIKEAEVKSVEIIKATEKRAKDLEVQLQRKNEETQQRLQKEMQENYEKQQQQARDLVLKNATELVKKAVAKTVELSPEAVDEALIKKAVKEIDNGKE